ncbi:hypothetical protein [Actinoplanes sp. URMC 104]|uniref:hypothetical protein n=1 Tax=Actinoplanes sp. URMC 104 TaxID=3423409 RepID=UPI003F1B5881
MLSRRWRVVLLAVLIAVSGVVLTLFLRAGTWAGADQIASTLGFFLALGGFLLGIASLVMQIAAARVESARSAAVDGTAMAADHTGGSPERAGSRLKLRSVVRIGTPVTAAGAGGCLVEIALGATVALTVGALICLAAAPGAPAAIEAPREQAGPGPVAGSEYPWPGAAQLPQQAWEQVTTARPRTVTLTAEQQVAVTASGLVAGRAGSVPGQPGAVLVSGSDGSLRIAGSPGVVYDLQDPSLDEAGPVGTPDACSAELPGEDGSYELPTDQLIGFCAPLPGPTYAIVVVERGSAAVTVRASFYRLRR